MSSGAPTHVVVLMGGQSSERDVSLSTGRGCAHVLRGEGYRVTEVDAGPDLVADLRRFDPDVVFNALHGRWGEDGCVQGLLEWLRIPYTHSGVMASSTAMDKARSKAVFAVAGLPVVASEIVPKDTAMAGHVLPPPYVIKPNNEGSSVGIYIVEAGANRPPQLAETMPDHVMVETYAPGRELTCTVLGDAPLTVTEIVTDGWYDYEAKYAEGGSSHVVPAQIPAPIFAACQAYALRAHHALGCRSISRTDFRWDESRGLDGLILLETNTQPGMTPTSLTPEQAAHAGLTFGQLCAHLVEDASCDR
ncbi:D-alanine--D-alanine ligase [Jannaschia pagri]|uniref:D-alanine--D-alanine ligase n=1 Tax=Jannaschia pagri TaxID=2829797 RepID=A0ABQ4NGD5_9RHOB|nr:MULTISPECIES: D-alanine--D-alanine ligase [unclassified Jannaschia]GIT90406.1 D-alanine--D-alanine ligase [Jannaschia sp. AI_61]GIT93489.1 D-alanine--D-alanine ligase [Jannaschia sp. AI_62]